MSSKQTPSITLPSNERDESKLPSIASTDQLVGSLENLSNGPNKIMTKLADELGFQYKETKTVE